MRLRNDSSIPLGLPGAISVAPGETVEVNDAIALNRVVAAWIHHGSMTVVEGTPAQTPEQEAATAPDSKDELIARLKRFGILRDRRSSEANLRKLLADVEQERSDG